MDRKRHLIREASFAGAMGGLLIGFMVAIKVILVQRELMEADAAAATIYLIWLPAAAAVMGYVIGVVLWLYVRWRVRGQRL